VFGGQPKTPPPDANGQPGAAYDPNRPPDATGQGPAPVAAVDPSKPEDKKKNPLQKIFGIFEDKKKDPDKAKPKPEKGDSP
jgi:hypothetical protein